MQRLLITGASGRLGAYLLHVAAAEYSDRFRLIAWSGSHSGTIEDVSLQPVNLTNHAKLRKAWEQSRADVVIHAAAVCGVQDCFRQPSQAHAVNTLATINLADMAAVEQRRMIFVSTDMVFDGEQGNYREQDAAAPLSLYGRTKLDAETAVLSHSNVAVARLSLLFGPSLTSRSTFFDEQCHALRESRPLTLFTDEWRSPLDFLTAARGLLELAGSAYCGRLHLAGNQRVSRFEMGCLLANALQVGVDSLVATSRRHAPASEPRPRDLSLNIARWRNSFPDLPRPDLQEALLTIQRRRP